VTTLLLVAAGTAIVACAGTALLRARAAAWGLMDVPNERSLHSGATPRGAGAVVIAAVLLGLAAMIGSSAGARAADAAAFAVTGLLVGIIGWRDDFRPVAVPVKFFWHVAAAAGAVAMWGTFDRISIPGAGELVLPVAVSGALTVLWLVGVVNAYNFMDGVDGIASGQAVVAGMMWTAACGTSAPLVGVSGALIAAASAGFLWHNRPPASIFLGDAGSGFLGFAFAVFPLLAYEATGDSRFPAAAVMILAPFVFDSGFTLCRRLLAGENVFRAHRSHLYQRLVMSGWPHGRVAILYVLLAVLSGGAGVVWLRGEPWYVLLPAAAAILLLPVFVTVMETRKDGRKPLPSRR
jgi:Fuc2NAc and GlcNAc transferase